MSMWRFFDVCVRVDLPKRSVSLSSFDHRLGRAGGSVSDELISFMLGRLFGCLLACSYFSFRSSTIFHSFFFTRLLSRLLASLRLFFLFFLLSFFLSFLFSFLLSFLLFLFLTHIATFLSLYICTLYICTLYICFTRAIVCHSLFHFLPSSFHFLPVEAAAVVLPETAPTPPPFLGMARSLTPVGRL